MLEPNAVALVVLLFLAAAGAVVAAILLRPVAVKVAGGLLALVLAASGGIAIVNDYYGYYQTWSQLSADLSGSYVGFSSTPTGLRTAGVLQPGELRAVTFAGARSGIKRSGIVYLPPQYFEKQYANTRFPVVELLHGSPGHPLNWIVHLRVDSIMNQLLAHHQIGPMILVMPSSNDGQHFEECLDAPGVHDDTYVTEDVPADVRHMFRVSNVPAEWGVGGYSSGAYCAANLALRHPGTYGAAGIMDAYFRPADGQAAQALHGDPLLEAQNDPLLRARGLDSGTHPLPSFWVFAGSGVSADVHAAQAFTEALHGVEQVTLYNAPHAGHNFYAWEHALPQMLAWFWTQLAPPALRVQFPIAGPVRHVVFPVPHTTHRKHPLVEAGGLRRRTRATHRSRHVTR